MLLATGFDGFVFAQGEEGEGQVEGASEEGQGEGPATSFDSPPRDADGQTGEDRKVDHRK